MLEFSEVLPLLRARIERDLRGEELTRDQVLATVIRLLDKTLIRVGNDEYARENKSFGLTTLRRRHVRVNGESLSFTFRGKSGVEHSITLEEPRLARIIQRCQDLPGHELFQYLDATAQAPGDFLGRREHVPAKTGRDVTAKDFRTWGGTIAAVELRAWARREPAQADRNSCALSTRSPSAWAHSAPCAANCYVHPSSCAPT
jgi:DNA topoisomerase-1